MTVIGYIILAAVGLALAKGLGSATAGASPTAGTTEAGTGAILFDSSNAATGPDASNGHTPATQVGPGKWWCPYPSVLWKDTHTGAYICVMPPSAQVAQTPSQIAGNLVLGAPPVAGQLPPIPVETISTPPVLVSSTPVQVEPSTYDPGGLVDTTQSNPLLNLRPSFQPSIASSELPASGLPDLPTALADRNAAPTLFGSSGPGDANPPDVPADLPPGYLAL